MQLSRVAEPGDPDACALVREHSAVGGGRAAVRAGKCRTGRLRPGPRGSRVSIPTRSCAPPTGSAARLRRSGRRGVAGGSGRCAALEAEPPATVRAGEPFGLWVRGPLRLRDVVRLAVAIVGARASTDYGDHVVRDHSPQGVRPRAGPSSPAARTASTRRPIAARWPPKAPPSRCSRPASTGSTRWAHDGSAEDGGRARAAGERGGARAARRAGRGFSCATG